MDYTQHPGYQRMVQRLGNIRPEQRAIWKTLSVDPQFANAETRSILSSLAHQQNVNNANRSLDLRERAFTSNMGLRRRAYDDDVKNHNMATGIGLGQVAAEAKYGMDRDALDMATYKKKMEFLDRIGQYYGGQ